MLFACTLWLKLVSYAHTNFDMRAIAKASLKVMSKIIFFFLGFVGCDLRLPIVKYIECSCMSML